jgi:hypothetical protein
MHYDMSLVSIVGGYWEAYDFNTVQPDGINVMYFGSEWWTAAPNEDLIRTPVYAMTGHKVVNLNGGSVSVGGKYSGKDVYLLQYGNQTFMENGSLDIAVQGGHDAWGEENGSIITVIGGAVLNRDCTTAMQKFDFDYNTQVTTHMNIGRCGHSSVELANGDIYVVGGRKSYSDSSERTATIEKYDASTQTWSVVGKLAHARSGHKVFKRGTSQLVVVGGTDASGAPIAQTEIITY